MDYKNRTVFIGTVFRPLYCGILMSAPWSEFVIIFILVRLHFKMPLLNRYTARTSFFSVSSSHTLYCPTAQSVI